MSIQDTLNQALQHHQNGQLDQAQSLYRQVLAQQPNHPDVLHLLGVLSSQENRHGQAADLINRAIALNPSAAHYHDNLGVALAAAGQTDQAILAHRRAIALKPDFAQAHNHLANALKSINQPDQAIASYRQAVQYQPGYAEAHYNLGVCFFSLDRLPESETAYRNAIVAQPNYIEAYNNLGACLYDQGRFDEAIACYRNALALQPDHPDASTNLGNALEAKGDFAQAYRWLQRAVNLKPDYARAHWNLALHLLLQGDFERGWPEYEYRWDVKSFNLRSDLKQPMWDGSDLGGRSILLFAEQGIGDAIQFVRYLPEITQRGGRAILMSHAHLRRLLEKLPGVERWVSLDDAIPPHDVHCPLMSLPRIFGTTSANIPAPVPYLKASPALAAHWQSRLPADGKLKVGLCWANRPNPRDRCPQPDAWAPLSEVNDVWFCSLQKEIIGKQPVAAPPGVHLLNSSTDLPDFAETAAVIANMDLVISVDTAVAHLAGAMGKPCWVPLKFVPDWRWFLSRDDCPWYPTMRLFRQPRLGDWETPVRQVADALGFLARR